jgi:DnaJ-class molecular chaperone
MPAGVITLLEIAAGDLEAGNAAATAYDRPLEVIQEAAAFFIEQVMLTPDADSYRVLGASPEAESHELRRNMALLLRWLHPDTGDADGRSLFAGRVTGAWENLKTPERREAYDRELASRQAGAARSRQRRSYPGGANRASSGPQNALRAFHAPPGTGGMVIAHRPPINQSSFLQRILLAIVGTRRR